MDSLINSMMLRRVSMHRLPVSLWAKATREVISGLNKSRKTRSTRLVWPQASVCPPRTCYTRQEAPWKKKMKPPRCISAPMVILALVSKGNVTTIGRQTLALQTQPVTFKHILSVTESRSSSTVQQSQSCQSASKKPSPRRLS